MRVDGAVNHNWQAHQPQGAAKQGQAKLKYAEAPPAEPSPEQPEAAPEYDGRAKDVIRKLMEGHFKGVADVRLRINFHEELMGLEQGRVAQAIAPQTEPLQILAADLEELKALAEGAEGLSDKLDESSFGEDIQQLLDRISLFLVDKGLSAEQAKVAALEISETFDRLSIFLNDLLAPEDEPVEEELVAELAAADEPPASEPSPAAAPVEEPPGEEAAPAVEEEPGQVASVEHEGLAEDAATEPDPFMDIVIAFLDKWSAELPELVASLQEGLAGVATLPPLTDPSGNGKAYAKFVAIYETLYYQAATPVSDEEPTGIELVA
jgi:hypothetical protein